MTKRRCIKTPVLINKIKVKINKINIIYFKPSIANIFWPLVSAIVISFQPPPPPLSPTTYPYDCGGLS